MNAKSITQLRLAAQGIHKTKFTTVEQVVHTLGAVQAQDYLGALWAIGLRMKSATEPLIEEAIAEKKIVRSWPMRGTLHFTIAEDLRWMLKHLAPRVQKRGASNYRQAGLDAKVFTKAAKIISRVLEGGNQHTREELYSELEKRGISTKDVRGLHILGFLALEGMICLSTRSGKQHRFALLDEWLPSAKVLSWDEALGELARRYFKGHGPAQMIDFAWWTGLTLTEAKRAISIVEPELKKVTVDGNTFWMSKEISDVKQTKSVYLLPAYDEFTVAYKDRSHLLNADDAVKARNGIFTSVIVVDGKIAGTWKRVLNKDSVSIEKDFFRKSSTLSTVEKRYAKFIGLPVA